MENLVAEALPSIFSSVFIKQSPKHTSRYTISRLSLPALGEGMARLLKSFFCTCFSNARESQRRLRKPRIK